MEMPEYTPRRPYTFDRVVRITFSVIIVLAVLYLLNALKGVLLPFFVACLIAYMLEPIVQWNMKWTHLDSRFIPVALTLFETCATLAVFCVLFIPYLVSETAEMTQMIRDYATTQTKIPYISDSIHNFLRSNIDFNEIAKLLSRDEWKDLIKKHCVIFMELSEFRAGINIRSPELADCGALRDFHHA